MVVHRKISHAYRFAVQMMLEHHFWMIEMPPIELIKVLINQNGWDWVGVERFLSKNQLDTNYTHNYIFNFYAAASVWLEIFHL